MRKTHLSLICESRIVVTVVGIDKRKIETRRWADTAGAHLELSSYALKDERDNSTPLVHQFNLVME